jgi:hypothetical protein
MKFFGFSSFLVVVVCLVFSSSAFALSKNDHLLIAQNLTEKLQNDLGSKDVRVKLNKVEEHKISKSEIKLSGDAVCLLTSDNRELPIHFDAKVDTVNQSIIEVKYDFVAADYNPNANEEVLMKVLMSKISRDYKTENIVIAIDAVENIANSDGEKKFLGVGEVRVGDLVWNRIKFDVVLDEKTQKANKIVYKIEK